MSNDHNIELLRSSLKSLHNTEEIAADTLETLTVQRSQLLNTKKNVKEATASTSTSGILLRKNLRECIVS